MFLQREGMGKKGKEWETFLNFIENPLRPSREIRFADDLYSQNTGFLAFWNV